MLCRLNHLLPDRVASGDVSAVGVSEHPEAAWVVQGVQMYRTMIQLMSCVVVLTRKAKSVSIVTFLYQGYRILSILFSFPRMSLIISSYSSREMEPLRYCCKMCQYSGALAPSALDNWAFMAEVDGSDIL